MISGALSARFRGLFKKKMADSPVQKAIVWLAALKKRKRLSQLRDETRPSLAPLFHALKRRQYGLLQAILGCLNPPRLREVWMHPHSFAWFDMVEASFPDELWYSNFRVTRGTFTYILHEIGDEISRQDTPMRKAVTPNRRLAIALYYLASTAEYRTIGNLFGVSVAFVCTCIKEVCEAIRNKMASAISFPSGENLLNVIQGYDEEWGFPMCGGAIDGTHIPILAPNESHADYVNRKGYHSIIMQAVVDHNHLYRDVVIGWPGSVHDARVLSNSKIFEKGNNNTLFPQNVEEEISGQKMNPVIIGDAAYPLLPWLMKPYPENSTTPRIKKKFNYQLSRARMSVENTFGKWKGRFIRFSKRVDMEISSLVMVITASCILHNICQIQNNAFLLIWQIDNEAFEDPFVFADDDIATRDATDIREALSEYFMS